MNQFVIGGIIFPHTKRINIVILVSPNSIIFMLSMNLDDLIKQMFSEIQMYNSDHHLICKMKLKLKRYITFYKHEKQYNVDISEIKKLMNNLWSQSQISTRYCNGSLTEYRRLVAAFKKNFYK